MRADKFFAEKYGSRTRAADIIRKGLMFTADWGAWNCLVAGEASDGEESEEKIRQINTDVVVADIRKPVTKGLKITEAARGGTG